MQSNCKQERIRTTASRNGIRLMTLMRGVGQGSFAVFSLGLYAQLPIDCNGRDVRMGP